MISALCFISCAAERNPAGSACQEMHECESGLICYEGTCSDRKEAGGKCDPKVASHKRHCEYGLECSAAGICETGKNREEREASEAIENERAMLRQSGVEPENASAPSAELPAAVPAEGLKVRVVRTTGIAVGLAACQVDERLVGGGCNSLAPVHRSYPSHYSESDTVGARWNCELRKKSPVELEAFALCQAVN